MDSVFILVAVALGIYLATRGEGWSRVRAEASYAVITTVIALVLFYYYFCC